MPDRNWEQVLGFSHPTGAQIPGGAPMTQTGPRETGRRTPHYPSKKAGTAGVNSGFLALSTPPVCPAPVSSGLSREHNHPPGFGGGFPSVSLCPSVLLLDTGYCSPGLLPWGVPPSASSFLPYTAQAICFPPISQVEGGGRCSDPRGGYRGTGRGAGVRAPQGALLLWPELHLHGPSPARPPGGGGPLFPLP